MKACQILINLLATLDFNSLDNFDELDNISIIKKSI